jgi:hypothetical protein
MELWTNEHPDGMTRRPDGWQGTEIFDLYNSAESSETLLNSGIPIKKHLYIQVILSNQNEANYKLTIACRFNSVIHKSLSSHNNTLSSTSHIVHHTLIFYHGFY